MRDVFFLARRQILSLFLFALAGAATEAAATNVQFVGNVGYSNTVNFAILTANQVKNLDVVPSGSLRLELWATPAPFSGSMVSGYMLAQHPLGPLAAGASFNNVNSSLVPYTLPPAGLWYVAMVLTEYTGAASNGGYTPVSYLKFPDRINGSGSPPPADTVPPTVSVSSPTGGNVSGLVTLAATASDNVGVTRVDFYVNGALVGSDSSTPYQLSWDSRSIADGAATVRAIAKDAAGNSGNSVLVSVTVANVVVPPADTVPPTVALSSPTGGTVSGIATLAATASDNVGVTRVDFYVNGTLVGSDSSAPYQVSWDSRTVADGAATVRAVAKDAAGNSGNSIVVSVTVANVIAPPADMVPPTVGIPSVPAGNVSGVITLAATASDNVGVLRVDFYINGQLVASDGSAPYQANWDSRNAANGAATLRAVAYDAAGNSTASSTATIVIDNSIAPPPPGPGTNTAQAIEYHNAALDHYFITASQSEIVALDSGQFTGWVRTGLAINVYTQAMGSANPVCRIYLPPSYGDSHFYSASPAECAEAMIRYPWFDYEAANVFYANLPDPVTGACPSGMVPVYRVWNRRVDTNHRYMTARSLRDQMVARGYVAEGYGPDAVIMCSPL